MKKFMAILLLCAFPILAAKDLIDQIPNPKVTYGGYVSDRYTYLSKKEIRTLDSILWHLDSTKSIEGAVVLTNSIGDRDPQVFAIDLFNKWEIGKKGRDNGFLIFAVIDQHYWQIKTGYGLESVLPDVVCSRIGRSVLVPNFKMDEYGKGMIETVTLLLSTMNASISHDSAAVSPALASVGDNDRNILKETLILILVLLGFAGPMSLVFFIPYRKIMKNTSDPYKAYFAVKKLYVALVGFIFFPVAIPFVWWLIARTMNKLRKQPRTGNNGKILRLLNDEEEDTFLSAGQLMEEQLKSKDYDVWISDDKDEVLVLPYDKTSRYTSCSQCNFKTRISIKYRVIKSATYTSSGKSETTFRCKNCGHIESVIQTIPRLSRSSGSGGSGGSHRSSFGGGHSGGGGAGGRW